MSLIPPVQPDISNIAPASTAPGQSHLPIAYRFRIGETVFVFRFAPDGRPTIEGRACIVRPDRQRYDYYLVRFDGEKIDRLRYVHPDWSEQPERNLALLRAQWLASQSPPDFDEFFHPPSSEKES